jgi:hypothetical protein
VLNTAEAPNAQDESPTAMSFRDYVLAEFRAAILREKLIQADLGAIGLALKGNLITTEQALTIAHGIDALRYIGERSDAE